jgi:secondary thiamine-phosphate synthase enzyme
MLRQSLQRLSVPTRGRGFYEVTDRVMECVARERITSGLATLQIRHTSASLVIQENADPGVRRDLEAFFQRLVPDGDPLFEHTAEGEDDMPAHVRAALTAVSLGIPVIEGRLGLGTWQGIFLWEHRREPHRREILVHLLGE